METYTCAENLSVRNINLMKSSLLDMLKKGDGVVIDFSINGLPEAIVAGILTTAVCKALLRYTGKPALQ